MSALAALLRETWNVLLVAAPFLLIGLGCAGLLHVVLSRRHVERWLGHEGLLGVIVGACFGMPLPLCTCGVVPVAMALRRKGASRSATLSFLITTPESGVDSLVLTWGMLGPVMAIARPLASFATALLAGVMAIAVDDDTAGSTPPPAPLVHDHDGQAAESDDGIPLRELWRSFRAFVWTSRRPPTPPDAADGQLGPDVRPFEDIIGEAFRYGFVDVADDIAFWLVVGLFVAGAIAVFVPNDLASRGLGSGIVPMIALLIAGMPLYMCASASTPIAAALVAKGISPGAALVFLLSGPASNAVTLVLLARHFGPRFVRLYFASVVVGALVCGLALDWLIAMVGWQVSAKVTGGLGGVALVQWLSAPILTGVLAWRLWNGAGRRGIAEISERTTRIAALIARQDGAGATAAELRRVAGQRVLRALAIAGVAVYAALGVRSIPADGRGYGFFFGRLVWPDLAPGLHYVPPAPFGRCDIWRVQYPRVAGVGFRPDLDAVAKRRQLTELASGELWHSPVSAASGDAQSATFLTGDENLIEISFAVQYGLSDPRAFFYAFDAQGDAVRLYAESIARELVAQQTLDALLTTDRAALETAVREKLQQQLDDVHEGVAVTAVQIVDIHPPQGAVNAFREISSAREDRETAINQAAAAQAREVPLARGEASVALDTARATAAAAETVARGQADAIRAKARAFATDPENLGTLLWLETAERVLSGREKLIVPPGGAGQNIVLWKTAPVASSGGGSEAPRPLAPLPPDSDGQRWPTARGGE